MSPLSFALRTAALALLLTTAATGQPLEPGGAEALVIGLPDVDRAETAAGVPAPAPQETRALGRPTPPAGPRRDPGAGASRRAGGLDPRVGEIARVGGALAAVVALLLVLRLALRRLGGPLAGGRRPSGVLEVLARYPVARGQQLVLLKLAGRVVLLHQTRTGMSTLSEVTDPDEVAGLLGRVGSSSSKRRGGAGGFPSTLDRLLAPARPPADDEFTRTLGRSGEIEGKVVVDLTRRPRRRKAAPQAGGAR